MPFLSRIFALPAHDRSQSAQCWLTTNSPMQHKCYAKRLLASGKPARRDAVRAASSRDKALIVLTDHPQLEAAPTGLMRFFTISQSLHIGRAWLQ